MDQADSRSHKRTHHAMSSESGKWWNCGLYQYGESNNAERDLKRQRPNEFLAVDPLNFFGTPNTSMHTQSIHYMNTSGPLDPGTNLVQDGTSFIPAMPQSSFSLSFETEGQDLLCNGVDATGNLTDSSMSCTATNGTFSPSPSHFPMGLDIYDGTTQSQGSASEQPFMGRDNTSFVNDIEQFWEGDNSGLYDIQLNRHVQWPLESHETFDSPSGYFLRPQDNSEGIISTNLVQNLTNLHPVEPWSQLAPTRKEGLYPPRPARTQDMLIPLSVPVPSAGKMMPPQRASHLKTLQPSKNILPDYGWSNITLESGPMHGSENRGPKPKCDRKPGRRQGPLKETQREEASIMRHHKACWACRLTQSKCSPGSPCDRCKNLKPSPWNTQLCSRTRLAEYAPLFVPDLVVSRLKESAVRKYVEGCTVEFSTNPVPVEMFFGLTYPTMCLTAYEYVPSSREHLAVKRVVPGNNFNGQRQTFELSYGPPVALREFNSDLLKQDCSKQVEGIIQMSRHISEVDKGDTSIISWKAFEIVNDYRRRVAGRGIRSPLLLKAAKAHTIHYILSHFVHLTPETAEATVAKLRRPMQLDARPFVTSKLLNLQIKHAMYELLVEVTEELLKDLEKAVLSKRTRAVWAETFCATLVLCLCIEAVQVASDSYAYAAIRDNPNSKLSRLAICRAMDETVFAELTDIFHKFHHSLRRNINPAKKMGFNPIRDKLKVDPSEGITQEAVDMVEKIKGLMEQHADEMDMKEKIPSFEPEPDMLSHHMAMRKLLSGRLVTKFLRSFLAGKTK